MAKLERKIPRLEGEVARLEGEAAKMQGRKGGGGAVAAESKETLLRKEGKRLRKEVEQAQASLSEALDEKMTLEKALKDSEHRGVTLKEDMKAARKEISRLQGKVRKDKSEVGKGIGKETLQMSHKEEKEERELKKEAERVEKKHVKELEVARKKAMRLEVEVEELQQMQAAMNEQLRDTQVCTLVSG